MTDCILDVKHRRITARSQPSISSGQIACTRGLSVDLHDDRLCFHDQCAAHPAIFTGPKEAGRKVRRRNK